MPFECMDSKKNLKEGKIGDLQKMEKDNLIHHASGKKLLSHYKRLPCLIFKS